MITWPALEHAVQGRPGWRRIGHEWHGPCPVTGGGRDCCWFGPGHGADVRGGCRACGGCPRCRSLPGPPGRADWPDPRRPFEYSGASRCQPGISRSWERRSIARVVGCARHPRCQTVRGWDAMKVMATQCKTCIYRGDKPPPPSRASMLSRVLTAADELASLRRDLAAEGARVVSRDRQTAGHGGETDRHSGCFGREPIACIGLAGFVFAILFMAVCLLIAVEWVGP